MTVTVLLFASYAEQLGRSSITLDLPEVSDLLRAGDELAIIPPVAGG